VSQWRTFFSSQPTARAKQTTQAPEEHSDDASEEALNHDTPAQPEEHVIQDQPSDFISTPLQTRLPYGIDAVEGSLPWGDMFHEFVEDPDNFRLLTQNVNTMNEHREWEQWVALGHAASELNVSALALQETNIDWTRELTHGAKTALRHKTKNAVHLSTSTSAEPTTMTNHKRGGTACALFGKWTGRLASHGSDKSGLGRWSYFTLHGRQGRKITIVSAYRPCQESMSQSGINSAYAQQHRLLNLQGERNPKPRQKFLSDLQVQVKEWIALKQEVIISMDANEDLRDNNSKLAHFVAETELVHLLGNRHNLNTPPTHTTKTIDYVFCTPHVVEAVKACGYLPYQHNAEIKGDHRGIFVDLSAKVLFGVSTPDMLDLSRGIISDRPMLVSKFGPPVVKACENASLLERSAALMTVDPTEWTATDGDDLNDIDKIFHDALLSADRLCHRLSKCPWTPAIHMAYLVRRYWELRVTARKRQRNLSHVLEPLESLLGTDRFLQNPLRTDTGQLRVARQELHRLRVNARQLREEFLTKQLEEAIQSDQTKRAKALRNIKRNEAKRRVWNMTKRHVKQGQQSGGGLSYIRVPVDPLANINDPNTQWREVHEPEEMEQHLLAHTQQHFAQAEGTPCTVEPLRSLLDYDGLSPFADEIRAGRADLQALDTDEYTKLLLENLASVDNPIMEAGEFSFDDLCKGFRKWRETTSTSPHGNHLGCYKALLKYEPPSVRKRKQQEKAEADKKKQKKPAPTEPTDPQLRPTQIPGTPATHERHNSNDLQHTDHAPEQHGTTHDDATQDLTGKDIMVIFYRLLILAVRHGHVYERWKTIHNFLLEKEPGNPKIHRLRFIHLYDAGYNFLLKLCLAKRLGAHVETHDTHVDEQGGGRAGRSAIDGAAKKAILFELIRLLHKQAINGDLDAVACFDRIVESIGNMACHRQGCSPDLLRLHSKVMKTARYHLRHKFGVSTRSNGHSDRHPFHGSGQGAGDSPIRWGLISASMIAAFNSQAARWELHLPDGTHHFTTCIDAFVDDTTMLLALDDECSLQTLVTSFQHNLDIWTGLLRATGGANNIKKSCVSLFLWGFDKHGRAFLRDPNSEPREISLPGLTDITIYDPDLRKRLPLRITTPSQATKLLGVHLTQDGNSKKQARVLTDKCKLYAQVVTATPLDRTDAHTLYDTVYCPATSYPLPATHLSVNDLRKIERPAVNAFLPKMGYNRHMPRAVVFAPQESLGCGLRSLQHEQGVQQAMLLIRHLRDNSTLGKSMLVLLRTYQVLAGTRDPVLMDTRPISYVERESKWLTTLRQFLTTAHAQIEIPDPWNVPLLRSNDAYIMELLLDEQRYSKLTLEIINVVRVFLRVTTLSDIVDHTGTRFCPQALDIEVSPDTLRPSYDSLRQSTYTQYWPTRHEVLPHSSIRLWKTVLTETFLDSQHRLHVPLGEWTSAVLASSSGRRWRYTASSSLGEPLRTTTSTQFLCDRPLTPGSTPRYFPIERTSRRHFTFAQQATDEPPGEQASATMVPVFPDPRQPHTVAWPLSPLQSPATPNSANPQPRARIPDNPANPMSFYQYVVQRLPSWERQWFFNSPVQIHTRQTCQPTLAELIQRGESFQICSDAATNTTQHSFYWTIVHKYAIVAEGGGIVPGDIQLANSGRSETVGTIAALRFLLHYSRFKSTSPPPDVAWDSYCDNAGMISTIQWMRDATRLYPGDRVMNDYDVRATLLNTVVTLNNEGLHFHHVKGHQDDTIQAPDTLREIQHGHFTPAATLRAQGIDLSLPAQMNIYCDHRATKLLHYWLDDGAERTQPVPLPFETVHLYIDHVPVFNSLPHALREASARDEYHRHLARTLAVPVNTVADIDWTALRHASSRFTQLDRTRIQKYFHGWLPTSAFLYKMSLSTTDRCPTCGTRKETKEHLLYCDNIRREPLWTQFATDLQTYFQETKTAPPLATLLLHGLTFGDKTSQQDISFDPILQAAHDYQDLLGWSQLIYGRFVYEWGHAYEESFTLRRKRPPSQGWMWVAGIIEITWKFLLTLWRDRNHDLHGSETSQQQLAEANRLHLRVRALYAEQTNIPAHSRHIFPMPEPDMLRQSPSQITRWLHTAAPFIKAEKSAMAIMERVTTHDIRNYFPPTNTSSTTPNPFTPTAGTFSQSS
jgi:hypothetical protein